MRLGRRLAALVVAAALGGVRPVTAQSLTLAISALLADSTSPAPVMTVTAFGTLPERGPYTVALTLSNDAQFRNPFYSRSVQGETGTFTIDSLLTEHTIVFFRARLIDRFDAVIAETSARHPVRSWVRLIAPLRGPTTIVDKRTPTFVWSSPPITLLWNYQITVIETQSGLPAFQSNSNLADTTYTPTIPLQANTSYRWRVDAHAANSSGSGEVHVASPGTFVISSDSAPTVTLLYQSFPNPFGRGMRSDKAAIWFDLAHPAKVKLTIYDLRQRMVRRLVPGLLSEGTLAPGAYGRDGTVLWDGTDDAGRVVPSGVYIAVFEGDGVRSSIKLLFRGP